MKDNLLEGGDIVDLKEEGVFYLNKPRAYTYTKIVILRINPTDIPVTGNDFVSKDIILEKRDLVNTSNKQRKQKEIK